MFMVHTYSYAVIFGADVCKKEKIGFFCFECSFTLVKP